MNRLIRNLGVKEDVSIKTIVSVEELMNYDMIYIYHHIKPGAVLDISMAGCNLKGDPRYEVKFKEFKLGYITISGMIQNLFDGQNNLQAEVVTLSKDKFMPIKELDIQLGLVAMKKVG